MNKASVPRPESLHVLALNSELWGKTLAKGQNNEQLVNVRVGVKALSYIPSLGATTLMLIQSPSQLSNRLSHRVTSTSTHTQSVLNTIIYSSSPFFPTTCANRHLIRPIKPSCRLEISGALVGWPSWEQRSCSAAVELPDKAGDCGIPSENHTHTHTHIHTVTVASPSQSQLHKARGSTNQPPPSGGVHLSA